MFRLTVPLRAGLHSAHSRAHRARAHTRQLASSSLVHRLEAEVSDMEAAGTLKHERVITTPMGSWARVASASNSAGDEVLVMCSNNYLGLSNHPQVIEAAHEALNTHGLGLASVRFIAGTQDIHKRLEADISAFHGTDDTILFSSCFDANAGLFEALLGPQDAVLSDGLNHASVIDGVRLCKAERFRYKHLDMVDLEKQLKSAAHARTRLIATDGVFSMDGDIAPLKEICDLADRHDAHVFVDDCHATGILGQTGRGTIELCDVHGRVLVVNSTLGKALGGATGGFSTGNQAVVDILRQTARPYLFSNTVAPTVVGASICVFEMLSGENTFVVRLRESTHRFRNRLGEAGFHLLGDRDCPIVPVLLNDARLAADMANVLLTHGIFVVAFSFPVVPKGKARIRTQISAAHTDADIDRAADAFISVGKSMGVI